MARLRELGVLVTGGAGGLGEAITRRLLAEGAEVVIADQRSDAASALSSSLGDRCHAVSLDVRDADSWENAVARAVELVDLGGLVNNAGVFWMGPLIDMPVETLRDLIDTNLTGALLGTRAVAPRLAKNGGGAIVNIASVDGVRPIEATAAYAAGAWGLRGLTRASALELGSSGIRVNAVCPSVGNPELIAPFAGEPTSGALQSRFVESSLVDGGRARSVTNGDVAAMVAFLLSDDAATCTGTDFVVDAGLSAGDGGPA